MSTDSIRGDSSRRAGEPAIADVPCPVCLEPAGLLVATKDRRRRPLKSVSCLRCGLIRVDPLPTPADLALFYESEYRQSYKNVRQPKLKHVYRSGRLAVHRLHRLSRLLPPDAAVLDIGCGSGEWLYVLRASGRSALGIEPDPAYAEFGRRHYAVDIRTGSLWSRELPGRSFDCITLFHVLEHLPNPVQSLARLLPCVKDSGSIVIEVPNINSVHQHPAKRFHYAHVIAFTPDSLALTLSLSGWKLVELSLDRHERNLFAIARKSSGGAPPASAQPKLLSEHPPPIVSSPSRTIRYYLRPATYLRWFDRMSQFAGEYRSAWTARSPREVLERLVSPEHLPPPPR